MIHQFDPHSAPDSEFEAGSLELLVPGNRGRMLDPRRTPVAIVALRPEVGLFVCEVLAFEDRGARWELPFEKIVHFQFALGSPRAEPRQVRDFEGAVSRFGRPLERPCDPARRARTLRLLDSRVREASAWLAGRSEYVRGGGRFGVDREPDPRLWRDLSAYMTERGLETVEREFARVYVSHTGSGETVKGHRVMLAELGLAPFLDTVFRDPETFAGAWSRPRRALHIAHRLAFVRALLERSGVASLRLFRGVADGGEERRPGFVSATFLPEVAASVLGPPGKARPGRVIEQEVPATRVFMTHLETEAMNRTFHEAEVVLIADPGNAIF